MADEIEKCLVARLSEAIEDVQASKSHQTAKSASEKLKKQLHPDEPNKKLPMGKLYNLNNLLAEWRIHQLNKPTRNYPFFESKIFDYNFSRNVNRELDHHRQLPPPNTENPRSTHRDISSNSSRSSDYEGSSSREITRPFRLSTRSIDPDKVYGLDDKAKSLQRLLVPRKEEDFAQFQAIGLVGKIGIGKTTLCQLIFGNPKVKNHFLPRIWVCLSRRAEDDSDSRKEVVKRILAGLGMEEGIIDSADAKHGLKGLLFALRLQLMGKRYLIVLDDVWSSTEIPFQEFCSGLAFDERKSGEKLAYGLPKGYGGAVVVTTRAEGLAKEMVGEENLHRIQPLSDRESCWKIFKDSFGGKDQLPPILEFLKEEIVDKCDGLPLAAKIMGQIAQEQTARTTTGSREPPG